ncbi:peptide chain release factor N(5)-glutamine methyltransferase [Antrihabitans sp. YC2-6]|uniref:peptide chain release factor N(5)-glutamine methyltransferase n=1 Tax=Antrihabitans sp. YC2-6 TaxID=2799498 RepID=UPI0018F33026|nr:peptide chain release factor N(5)-glutamine methyltransferase [Antrihabitans sp. YC2-6]MBJ8348201.1 peptide chain release factor N(5)-glutamine methyltransferase [Antrihabitans sp. YC2-6]
MSRQPLRPALLEATAQLAAAGVHSPRNDAEEIAAHLLDCERTRLGLVPLIEPTVLEAYRKMIDQRAKRIPLQYITGTAPMGEIDLEVGPGVFVPRPETELLLCWALGFLESGCQHPPVVLDLCTGSGALALAIAHARPDAVVHAVELDKRALTWARRNADLREADGDTPVTIYEGDVTDPSLLPELDGKVDVIVANPPYIPAGVALEPEVAEHDPAMALFAGPEGLDVITPMIANVSRWLRVGGGIAIEHDDSNGAKVAELLGGAGEFAAIAEHPDLAGKPRFVVAVREPARATVRG